MNDYFKELFKAEQEKADKCFQDRATLLVAIKDVKKRLEEHADEVEVLINQAHADNSDLSLKKAVSVKVGVEASISQINRALRWLVYEDKSKVIIKCNHCKDTGEVVAVEHMGSQQMMYCPYCELGNELEEKARMQIEGATMLEEDEIDKEILG